MSRVHESGNGRLLLIGNRLIIEDIVWLHRNVIELRKQSKHVIPVKKSSPVLISNGM
mgnify:CR=1 FL=1